MYPQEETDGTAVHLTLKGTSSLGVVFFLLNRIPIMYALSMKSMVVHAPGMIHDFLGKRCAFLKLRHHPDVKSIKALH